MGGLSNEQHEVLTKLFEAVAAKAEIEKEIKYLQAKAMRIQTPIDPEPETLSCEDDEEWDTLPKFRESTFIAFAALILMVLAWVTWDRGMCVKFPAWLALTLSSCLVLAVAREGMRE